MRTNLNQARKLPSGIRGRPAGLALIECLVYVSLWLLLVGFGFALFYRTWGTTRRLARGADDVVRSLRVGEAWRADVRHASGEVRLGLEESAGVARPVLVIPHDRSEISYAFTGTNILRRTGGPDAKWSEALSRVQSSRFLRETNAGVVSWRWELELRRPDAHSNRKPLLTFLAVERGEAQP